MISLLLEYSYVYINAQLIDGISIIILGTAIMDWIVIEDIIWRHCHSFACVLLLPFIGTVLSVIIRDVKNRVSIVNI